MCATVVEIINGKLLMMEGQNGITTYAPCHFMAGAKNVYYLKGWEMKSVSVPGWWRSSIRINLIHNIYQTIIVLDPKYGINLNTYMEKHRNKAFRDWPKPKWPFHRTDEDFATDLYNAP